MSLTVWAENNDGEIVEWADRLRVASLEATINAEECSAGSSEVELDDSTADFYIRGLKPIYFVESEATGDDYLGIIGPFWTEQRRVSRGTERTGSRRVWRVTMRDLNSLLTYRVQKGTDAERDAETDVERMTWLINTAEVIGGHGDHGFTIEETEFFFTDDPEDMSESNYTGTDSASVINDCMQQSGANAYLYNSPEPGTPIRVGIWYGRTERSDYASLHKISNAYADVSPEYWSGFDGETPQYDTGYVFPPSFDASLDRDPSRQITGAMVQFDGDYVYTSNPVTYPTLTRRDMSFSAELVKNSTQALARAQRYLDDLEEEDDAIECAVTVPAWLVHAFMPGHRVQFKNSYMPGYEDDYVWMRVARVTVRQITGEDGEALGSYELGLDLRAETPPGPPLPALPGPLPCPDDSPGLESQGFPPLGGASGPATGGDAANRPSPYVVQYFRPGLFAIQEPQPVGTETGDFNSWQFPVWGAGGAGTADYAGANLDNELRIVTVSAGTLSIDGFFSHGTSGEWRLTHYDGVEEVIEQSGMIALDGSPPDVDVPADEHCYHVVHISNWSSAGPGRFTFQGAAWDPVLE